MQLNKCRRNADDYEIVIAVRVNLHCSYKGLFVHVRMKLNTVCDASVIGDVQTERESSRNRCS